MEQEKKRRKWILYGAVALAVTILFDRFVLGSTRVPIEALRSSPLVDSKLVSIQFHGDVLEPSEFTEYEWRGSKDFSELERELKAKGMRLIRDQHGFRIWMGGDLEVSLVHDSNPEVHCWRTLDNGLLTRFRMWLLERHEKYQRSES